MLNLATGEWDDEEHPLGGDVGEQSSAPVSPMPPPPSQAPGPEVIPPPPAPNDAVLPPSPGVLPSPPPEIPQVASYQPAPPAAIPTSRVVTPAEAANLGAIDKNTGARMATAQDQGNVRDVGAGARDQAAERDQFLADAKRQELQRIQDDAAKRIQQRTQQANADYQEYKAFGIKDPAASDSFATRILKAIAVGLGGYAAGINGGPNQALQIITEANKDNIARQKAQQEKLFQVAQRSGKDVEQARQDRDDAFKQLDLKHSALLESSAAMLRSELARLGVPQAQIDANRDVQKIEQEGLAIRERTLGSIRDDETSLARADIAAAARAKKPAAGGGAGGARLDVNAKLAEYAQANPGDTAGLYRLAAKEGLSAKAGEKAVNAAVNQNKISGEQGKEAGQGAVALRAIDAIEKANYTPGREDIQKWLANQRDVARAASMSEGKGVFGAAAGGLANLAQSKGILAQNEFDGLSKPAKEYFTNVRRYMETIGRVQSGAAISASEWGNFYGQYGPQSEGGLEAARQFARDRFRMSGVAGRVLERGAGGAVPATGGGKADDPRAKLAREAIADPKASRAEKAKALQILRSLNLVDTL